MVHVQHLVRDVHERCGAASTGGICWHRWEGSVPAGEAQVHNQVQTHAVEIEIPVTVGVCYLVAAITYNTAVEIKSKLRAITQWRYTQQLQWIYIYLYIYISISIFISIYIHTYI